MVLWDETERMPSTPCRRNMKLVVSEGWMKFVEVVMDAMSRNCGDVNEQQ